MKLIRIVIVVSAFLMLPGLFVSAKVKKVEISERTVILNGQEFGDYGKYEYLKGRIWFELDPANFYNSRVTDLYLAKRNENGMVEAVANFEVLQPVVRPASGGTALVEVSNRGGKASLRYFNRGNGSRVIDPSDPAAFGDGLLMRAGLTVIWVGWQFDVPVSDDILRLEAPGIFNPDGSVIDGVVRSDWTLDSPANTLSLGHRQQSSYPVSDINDSRNELTVRDGRESARIIVPSDEWEFGVIEDGVVKEDNLHICSVNGFEEGMIYELVYVSDRPVVTGMGLTAIRDIISYAKYDDDCPFPVTKGVAAGVSQTGRFLRHFLYQGFNTDELGKKAYDGMMIITAGAGRGSFNHRFAQPSRDAHRYSAFFYPTDIFPFTSSVVQDSEQWRSDGLLAHMWNEDHIPKIFYCNTSYEYWGRAASLIHTDPDGFIDIEPLPNERIYTMASGQHYVGRPPSERNRIEGTNIYRGNSLDFSVNYRSLLVRLVDWVTDDTEPPASAYPTILNGTLVPSESLRFPMIEGLIPPTTIHVAYLADYGPRWSDGIVDYQPPLLTKPFPSLVSAIDEMGNDIAGIRNVEIRVPLGTYFPWNLRTGFKGGSNELTDFTGTFIPIITEVQENSFPDSRPVLTDLYRDKQDFELRVTAATSSLVQSGYILSEDIEYVTAKAMERWKKIAVSKK